MNATYDQEYQASQAEEDVVGFRPVLTSKRKPSKGGDKKLEKYNPQMLQPVSTHEEPVHAQIGRAAAKSQRATVLPRGKAKLSPPESLDLRCPERRMGSPKN